MQHPPAAAEDAARPKRMNLTQYAAMLGLPTSHDVESHIHAGLRSKPTTKSYQRWFDARLAELQSGRDEAVRRYWEAVACGEIRAETQGERLEGTAAGHPDNPSVQAARRVLEKRRTRAGEAA